MDFLFLQRILAVMKSLVLFSMVYSLALGTLFAQQIEGKVINEKGEALENVTVYNRRSGSHAHSSAAGTFKLGQTKTGDTLQFSLLGYQTRFLAAG